MSRRGIWNKFVLNLKKGDHTAVTRALVYFGFRYSGLLLALPAIVVLWILKPFFWLRIGKLNHTRIGHLALETDLFLRHRQLGRYPEGAFYCFLCDSRGLANRQLLAMFQRILRICENRILVALFDGILPLLKHTPFHQPLGLKDTEYYEFNNTKASIYLTPGETQKGRELLKRMNIDYDNDKYVCVFARDRAFFKQTMPYHEWGIQYDIRNSDIDHCIEAVQYLIEQGFTVIRVGAIVSKPIGWSHPRLIDYSISEHQCDFLDTFLLVTCKFYIGGPSGLGEIPIIAGVPRLTMNQAQLGYAPIGKNCLYIPKKHRFIKTGRYLRFKEAFELKLDLHMRNMHELGLELEDNSPQDILEATREMVARVEETFQYSPEEEKLMRAFQELWSQSDAICKNVPTPIGVEWLKKNKDLFGISLFPLILDKKDYPE